MSFEDFSKGDRVTLSRVRDDRYRGHVGTVRRAVKSRQVITVDLDDGRIYDAVPANIDKAT